MQNYKGKILSPTPRHSPGQVQAVENGENFLELHDETDFSCPSGGAVVRGHGGTGGSVAREPSASGSFTLPLRPTGYIGSLSPPFTPAAPWHGFTTRLRRCAN